jgi:tRNA dimethylallyltransferase
MVTEKIEDQWKNGKTPIVVGGTGLYFKALTDGLVIIPDIPNNIRKKVRTLHKKIGSKKFFVKLIKLDPLAKRFVLSSDAQRSMRAYEVKKFTNKSLFDFTKKTKSNFNNSIFKKIFINTPRELLHKKIEKRVEKMFNNGVIEEVRKFNKIRINKELSSNKIIGIKEIRDYLRGKVTLITAKELITQKTRQYAKRQFTWYRGHMKSWETIYSANINDLFKKAINKIS